MRSDLTAVCVDDSPIELGVIRRILEEHGIRVVACETDGAAGLTSVRRFRPSIVTLDIVLPQLNGIDVLKAMRKDGNEAMVFMASSMGMNRIKSECNDLGVKGFIVKPYDEVQTWIDMEPLIAAL